MLVIKQGLFGCFLLRPIPHTICDRSAEHHFKFTIIYDAYRSHYMKLFLLNSFLCSCVRLCLPACAIKWENICSLDTCLLPENGKSNIIDICSWHCPVLSCL